MAAFVLVFGIVGTAVSVIAGVNIFTFLFAWGMIAVLALAVIRLFIPVVRAVTR